MSSAVGVLTKAAFRKAGEQKSWGDETAPPFTATPGAGHALPLISESLITNIDREDIATLYARAGLSAGQKVGEKYNGQIILQGMYNNLDRLIACAMGFENPNDPGATYHGSPESNSGKYVHIYELDDTLAEEDWSSSERLASGAGGGTWTSDDDKVRFGNLFIKKDTNRDWCFLDTMFDKFVFSANYKRISTRFDVISRDYSIESDSTANSANWTIASDETHLIMPNASFYIGTTDGSTLTWQEMGLTAFELVLENNLEVIADTASGQVIREPRRNDRRRVYGGFDFARYENDDIIDRLSGNDELKAWIKFSVGSYKFNIYLPSFYLTEGIYSIDGPGVIKPKHKFTCHKPSSDPFSADTDYQNINLKKTAEFWILIQNDYSANVITEEA